VNPELAEAYADADPAYCVPVIAAGHEILNLATVWTLRVSGS
jgi:hypothetical protein